MLVPTEYRPLGIPKLPVIAAKYSGLVEPQKPKAVNTIKTLTAKITHA